MTFGDNALFANCRFDNVTIQSASTDGCTFRNCIIAGRLRNMIWRGAASPALGKLAFEHCDLSGAKFENISIYAGVDFSSTVLPAFGIRVFSNPNGVFASALRKAASSLEKPNRTPLEVLGNESCQGNQDPVVFDFLTLERLLASGISRAAFETVAKKFEIAKISE